jgi:hypothetical protein
MGDVTLAVPDTRGMMGRGMTSFLKELGRALSWQSGEGIAMVWVYYDESGEYDQRGVLLNMSMGGCVSRIERWEAFRDAWMEVLNKYGLTQFHMTDFEAWVPPFDFKLPNGTRDKEGHNALLNKLLSIMLNHIEGFCAFTAGNQISMEPQRAHQLALEDCTASAVGHAVNDLWHQYREPINLVFGKQKHFGRKGMIEYVELYN